ncbi:uncharacterized protein PG986_011247 [Apiospora aurea]|uniref:Uncharacterized protein n=1 Tax=Apiospora aurea TaxID=335848 RepID=A0ABR1Q4K5_9PEZI
MGPWSNLAATLAYYGQGYSVEFCIPIARAGVPLGEPGTEWRKGQFPVSTPSHELPLTTLSSSALGRKGKESIVPEFSEPVVRFWVRKRKRRIIKRSPTLITLGAFSDDGGVDGIQAMRLRARDAILKAVPKSNFHSTWTQFGGATEATASRR